MLTEKLWQGLCVVLAALLLALGAYHLFETKLLKDDIASKAKVIRKQTADIASLTAENVVLHAANEHWAKEVKTQNDALDALKKERDEVTKKWQEAAAAGAVRSKTQQAEIERLRAQQAAPGQPWYEKWRELLNGYYGAGVR